MKKQGQLVVFSAPSGVGKDSIIKGLLKLNPAATRLVTTTSRPPRPGNQEGVDYYFISKEEFEKRIENDEFVEYNIYTNNYYGIQKKHLEETLSKFPLILTQLDINGKKHLEDAHINHTSIFILPEELDILRKRLENRGGLSKEEINRRLDAAKNEITFAPKYDYSIVNYEGKLQETIEYISNLIKKLIS